ncbi:MAG: hypothetical protein E6176_05715 [Clostridium celatum]|uniref:hypothetical protein n=1 Tax=uncultured Clostridium sp. TaxID=59620 RepID=UPI0025DB68CB|nr:hypothetical protein [uncultured Clostridium sp.]MDU4884540.1 hypothetical protein [Clostridium celatum]MDU5261912.1 hypothetical protein [Clostridium celatum]MDU7077709.1 hypothetical protein [Clostridium celatum]
MSKKMNWIYKTLFIIFITIIITPFNNVKADTINGISIDNIESELIIGNNNLFNNNEEISVFISASNLMPGDYIEKDLLIKNKSNKVFNIVMNAEEITNKEDEFYLLDKLEITLIYDDKVIYQGKASDIDILNNNYINLGKIIKSDESVLKIIAELDGSSVGNDFQSKDGIFNINFFINEEYEDYSNYPNNVSKLPQTGKDNIIHVVLISALSILVGYNLIKK